MGLMMKQELYGLITTFEFYGTWDSKTHLSAVSYLDEFEDIDLLVMDFTKLEAIDSTFIGAILNAINLSHDKNITLQLQGLSALTQETFKVGRLYDVVDSIYSKVG